MVTMTAGTISLICVIVVGVTTIAYLVGKCRGRIEGYLDAINDFRCRGKLKEPIDLIQFDEELQ